MGESLVDSILPLLGVNLGLVITAMVLLWVVSVRMHDVSVVDIGWGAAGALIALATFFLADGVLSRKILLTAMATIWGVRLALHIGVRKKGKGEDFRYAAMRAEFGESFPLRSLFTVFLFQAFLIWIITIPVQVGQLSGHPERLTWLDILGAGLWVVGYVVELIADRQLNSFLADPTNAGKVLDQGIWRYSRHPNYFGESLLWWGVFLVAAATPGGWITIFSPIIMTFFLLKISGVPMLEKALADRREGYRDYMARTSVFFPWPPAKG
jgi:steroid 5-alpha reductase family enzyme